MRVPHQIGSGLFALLLLISFPVSAQQLRTMTAQSAMDLIRSQFGASVSPWIAEIRATGGQPQPLQWDVVLFDENSPGLLHRYTVSAGRARDSGPEERRYPSDIPDGFFTSTDLGVDSVAAFTIAEAEARKARLGFDSCDYFLRSREYIREPIWQLDLVDAAHRLVGTVHLSGTTGEVLRTVWVIRDSISGFPRFVDSLSPLSRGASGMTRMAPEDTGVMGPGLGSAEANRPVSPELEVPMRPTTPPRTGSIFREFPLSGGGSRTTRPIAPSDSPPQVSIPEPEPLPEPPEPSPAPAPPIQVPSNGGSAERIPPPPVPGR